MRSSTVLQCQPQESIPFTTSHDVINIVKASNAHRDWKVGEVVGHQTVTESGIPLEQHLASPLSLLPHKGELNLGLCQERATEGGMNKA